MWQQILKGHTSWLWFAGFMGGILASLLPPILTDSPNAFPISILILLFTLAVAWWRWSIERQKQTTAENQRRILEELRHQEDLEQQFALCKPAEKLEPED